MDPLGDVGTYDTGDPVERPPAGLDIRHASVAPGLRVELEPVAGTPPELLDWVSSEDLLLWIAFHEPIPVSPTTEIEWLFALDLDGNVTTGRPQGSVRINPDLGYEASIGVLYKPTSETELFFLVWDPAQAKLVPGPEVPRFEFFKDRTLIGLALPLETLTQTVEQVTNVTLVSEAVRGRAAAVSYELDRVDFYPNLPQE